MLAVNDMFCLATPGVTVLFHEDAAAWLDGQGIRYTPRVRFRGKSGYDYLFDFAIPRSRKAPERLVRAINSPSRKTALALAFAWHDTRSARPAGARAYALLNDADGGTLRRVVTALDRYEVAAVAWSERDLVREELAA